MTAGTSLAPKASGGGRWHSTRRSSPAALKAPDVSTIWRCLFVRRGDLEEGERLYTRALEIKRRKAPDSLEVATTLLNMGTLAAERGNPEAARAHCQEALALRQKLAPNSAGVAVSNEQSGRGGGQSGQRGGRDRQRTRAPSPFSSRQLRAASTKRRSTKTWARATAERWAPEKKARRHFMLALEARRRLAPGSADVAKTCYSLGLLSEKTGIAPRPSPTCGIGGGL